ncbi:MAG: amino acid adenylation domain-containing protein [Defluviitaleaceae bacterium]|nr:amino acid adenylation domain-containing protein [Defluviitaleaceae bacterium]
MNEEKKIEKIYSLTPLQEGMLFHNLENSKSTDYIVQNILTATGNLDKFAIRKALDYLEKRHAVLRTSIVYERLKSPKQVVLSNKPIEFNFIDLSLNSIEDLEKEFKKIVKEDLQRGFNLTIDSLIRLTCVKYNEDNYKFIWCFHHIIMDGWCLSLVFGDFFKYYNLSLNNKNENDILVQIEKEIRHSLSYSDYISWLSNQDHEESINYWRNLLYDYEGTSSIDSISFDLQSEEQMAQLKRGFGKELTKKLINKAKENNVTLNTIVESAWGIILQNYNNSHDVVFGKTVSGRDANLKGIDNTIGLFINTIPVRVKTDKDIEILDLWKNTQKQANDSISYQYSSLADIQRETIPKKNLIQTLFVFENYHVDEERLGEGMKGLSLKSDFAREQINYDIGLSMYCENEELIASIMYDPRKYCLSEIERLLDRINKVLLCFSENENMKVSMIDLITVSEKNKILTVFNNTDSNYDRSKTIIHLFEEQVEKTPNNIAIVYEDKKLTYKELNVRVNQLAHFLREKGIKQNDFVGIFSERSIEMIISIYAIIKSGAAYVPIDTNYPDERIRYILEDSNPKIILTNSNKKLNVDFEIFDFENINLIFQNYSNKNPEKLNELEDLAYVIYTSGTTGNPKGVMVMHKGIVCLKDYLGKVYEVTEKDNVLQFANYVFDGSVWEMSMALFHGATLVIPSNEKIKDINVMEHYCEEQDISIVALPPNYYVNMKSFSPRILVTAGSESSKYIAQKAKNSRYINEYGQTENTVSATYFEQDNHDFIRNKIPIGKPKRNTKVYILNYNKLCGIGIQGEICISGDSLAKGYLNRKELTKEKFISNPYGKGILYRSGDIGRWLEDGNIEFLGRIDEQVKIRGFRIELGEIESVLRNEEIIKDVAIISKKDNTGDIDIYVYFVSESHVKEDYLKEQLSKKLPSYMIPNYFIQIDKIPTTINGKLDKRNLPEIKFKTETQYIGPRNNCEEILSKIFKNLLNILKLSIKDNFFSLGGHSLRAARLLNIIEAEFGIRLTITDIFSNPTVEQLSILISKKSGEYESIPFASPKKSYKMSSSQKRTYLIQQMDKNNVAYNMPHVIKLIGKVDVEKLKTSLIKLINRHEILRTNFYLDNSGEFIQEIKDNYKLEFSYLREIEKDFEEETELLKTFVKPFDLSNDCLIRMQFVDKMDYGILLFDIHHIISDGMSIGLFISEFSKLYNEEELEDLIHQYKDYSEWMDTRDLSSQKEYWNNLYKDEIPILNMPTDYMRPLIQSFKGSYKKISISKEDSILIKKLSNETKSTEYIIFLSSIMVLVGKYSNCEDVIIGSPVSGRTHKDTEKILGMFVNTLAMRGFPYKNKKYIDFLNEVKDFCFNSYENQEYPYEKLIDDIDLRRDLSRNPLFDIMLVMQNNEKINFSIENIKAEIIDINHTVSKFDLTFNVDYSSEGYDIFLEYNSDLYSEASAKRILYSYVAILKQICRDKNLCIKDLDLTSSEDKEKILLNFNKVNTSYSINKTVIEIFEEQVEKTPNNIAVICGDTNVTYKELNEKVNKIANFLRAKGILQNDFVGIVSDRSIEMIVGIYGIIKAGAAYVPIDSKYPAERIRHIIDDCNPKFILSPRADTIDTNIEIINLFDSKIFEEFSLENPKHINLPEDLLYLIYTSGTTGKPKGVMIEHRNVVSLNNYFKNDYKINEEDNILQFANYVFDASVWEMTMALYNGASLAIPSFEIIEDQKLLFKYCVNEKITIVTIPPNYYVNMDDLDVRIVITAGSESSKDIVLKSKNSLYINAYGPTENTVVSTHWIREHNDIKINKIPIGKPIVNTQIYILDGDNLCGIGMSGEICIAGTNLSRGYLNNDKLTKEKFVNNPYGEGKIYRSGDLARWLEDGNIEYLGRIDEQVKIRGFRIEISEIEFVLRNYGKVKEAAVIVYEDDFGDKSLHAYFVCEDRVDVKNLREIISRYIPDYMIPSNFMQIDRIPVTTSGKINKRALPKIEFNSDNEFIAPTNDKEKALSEAFKKMLGIENISITDDFFSLGGDSIKAIRIVSEIRNFGFELNVRDIMMNKTIEFISKLMKKYEEFSYEQGEVIGTIKPTPIIQTFENWNFKEPHHFNQSMIIKINFGHESIEEVIKNIVTHHDILRAVYLNSTLEITKNAQNKYKYEICDLRESQTVYKDIKLICEEKQRSMNLKIGPLFKCISFFTNNGHYLFIVAHHLIIDGVSWRILIEDINMVLKQIKKNEEIKFPGKTASFIEWSEALYEYKKSDDLKKEKDYWEHIENSSKEYDYKNKIGISKFEYKTIKMSISEEYTTKLLKDSNKAYNTKINDLLLSAFALAIKESINQDKISIILEGHGREQLHKDIKIDRTVGWFTIMYPVILNCYEDIETSIIETKEMLRKIPNNGIGFGLISNKFEGIDVSFNYLGEVNSGIDFEQYDIGRTISEKNRQPGGSIAINCLVKNKSLIFDVSYDKGMYDNVEINKLVKSYETNLLKQIDYCVSKEDTIKTLSDFTESNLSKNVLSILQNIS